MTKTLSIPPLAGNTLVALLAFVLLPTCGGDEFSSATAAGGESGGGGSGGTGPGGGSTGSGGTGPGGGSAGSGPVSCSGAFECDGAELHSCSEGQVTPVENCATAALCDADAGECLPPACDTGEYACSGDVLLTCNADRTGFEPAATCASAALCDAVAGECDSPACEAGEYRCSGSRLEACSADRTGFVEALDCSDSNLCNADAGACDLACTPNAYQCTNATLLRCNAAGSSVTIEEVCFTAALCNETQGQCDAPACAPGQYDCDGATLRVCNEDRTGFEDVMACATAALCVPATGTCSEPACSADDYECQGSVLRRCKADRTGFEVEETCSAASQDCTLDPPGCRELSEYASVLDGLTVLGPCLGDYPQAPERVCYSTLAPCPASTDPILGGARVFDQTLTFGGDPGTIYDVTVRVQGQVESKLYAGGADQSAASTLPADGFYVGGQPDADPTSAPYNVYVMRVSSPAKDYFFNSIATSAGDSRIRQSTFDVDFQATIPIEGGASVRLVASDPNCLTTKNCADPDNVDGCVPHSFANLDSAIAADVGPQPYDGQFVGFLVQSVSRAP